MKNRGKASGKFSVCFDGFSIRPDYEKNWKKMQAFFKGTMKKRERRFCYKNNNRRLSESLRLLKRGVK